MNESEEPSAIVLGSVHMDLIATARRLPGRANLSSGRASPYRPVARVETKPVSWSSAAQAHQS